MKKTFEVIKTVLTWLIVLLAVCMMVFTIVSVTTFDRNDRALFGYKMYIVRSDSMSATDFKAGDLILVRSVDPATLQEGDIIAYTSQDTASFGETVTHKIRSLTTDADGQPAFITYGTTTDTDDEMPVTYPYVLGKYEKCLSGVGNFFQFLKTTPGYILCIFLPFFLLILMEGINCVRLFKRYKSEEQREIQAQQANLERQREENQRMMQELMEMKAPAVLIESEARTSDRTGVEMEAIIAAQVAAATVYDMCKAVQKDMVIRDVRLVHKSGGRTGTFERRASGERG